MLDLTSYLLIVFSLVQGYIIYGLAKRLREEKAKRVFKPPAVVQHNVKPIEICCSRTFAPGLPADYMASAMAYDIAREIENRILFRPEVFVEVIDYSKPPYYGVVNATRQQVELKYIINILPPVKKEWQK